MKRKFRVVDYKNSYVVESSFFGIIWKQHRVYYKLSDAIIAAKYTLNENRTIVWTSDKKYIGDPIPDSNQCQIFNRLEIIDQNGRAYIKHNITKAELSYQDNGKTLKIFIK